MISIVIARRSRGVPDMFQWFFKYFIQEGYLEAGFYILWHVIEAFVCKHRMKPSPIFYPFKKWTWETLPENYRSTFYVAIIFGILFVFMTVMFISAPGYVIIFGHLSLICWVSAIRFFFRVRRIECKKLTP